ncbi:phage tail protein [Enterococcus faecium]
MTDCIHSIIDGFPDYLHKLALAERPTIPSPKRQRVETSVLGRLGGLVQDYSFEDMSFTLHYNYLEDVEDHQAFKQSFYIMRHWLNYAKKLEFSDDPNVYYVIQTIDIGDAENDIVEGGEFDVNITAKPFARVQEDVPITVDKPRSFSLLNNSLEESFPKIIITPSATSCQFILNDYVFSFEGLVVGTDIVIDSDLMLCYEEQSDGDILDRSNKMKTMQYPTLQVDINHFNCTGLSKIQIYRNGLR